VGREEEVEGRDPGRRRHCGCGEGIGSRAWSTVWRGYRQPGMANSRQAASVTVCRAGSLTGGTGGVSFCLGFTPPPTDSKLTAGPLAGRMLAMTMRNQVLLWRKAWICT
jgi:hypothetical protein